VEQDYTEAVKWYRKAAEQGNARAQNNLGMCYEYGKGVEQDYVKAVKWYHKAAERGNASAQFNLGFCYNIGKGFAQDYDEAVKWYRKAAEQGHTQAKDNLKELEAKMRESRIGNTTKQPYYLFFDTETTGVPRNYNAPASNTQNWPRLVQLGWIVTDEEGNTLSQGNEIVKPEGFVIPADAARVHGITTERAQREGKPLREVIEAFLKGAQQTKCIVGHNISFDQKVVGAELYRLGIPDTISTAKSLCTMQAGTDYCKIPGYYGYKWPKLQELHHKLFGCDFEDAHDAMADITATKKCFFEMRKRGLI
jgi:DNA polymerase III epsilon subunit-like protein